MILWSSIVRQHGGMRPRWGLPAAPQRRQVLLAAVLVAWCAGLALPSRLRAAPADMRVPKAPAGEQPAKGAPGGASAAPGAEAPRGPGTPAEQDGVLPTAPASAVQNAGQNSSAPDEPSAPDGGRAAAQSGGPGSTESPIVGPPVLSVDAPTSNTATKAPAATDSITSSSPSPPTASQPEAKGDATPAQAAVANADAKRNNLRIVLRAGAIGKSARARYVGDSGVSVTYFRADKAYFLFANVEAVFLERGYDHFESEVNASVSPFYEIPWLAPVSFSLRATTDWSEYKTLGFGPSINLTDLPFMAPAKAVGFNVFFQYYPLKTDDHWGDQDFMFYWSIPLYGKRLCVRGFARLFVNYHREPSAWIGNDLIFEAVRGFDIYLRHAEVINMQDVPRRSGFSGGVRVLRTF